MSTEKYNFIKLLQEYEIQIPIIQRDYAQGRKNEKSNEVRKVLLQDIKKCLEEDNGEIDFNFVYGFTNYDNDIFYPVDGQQRLTTLYLLHWFLVYNSENHERIESFNNLKTFTYKTRKSASDFFSLLKEPNIKLKEIVKKKYDIHKNESLKKDIENESWFQIEWKSDPTVDAVLTFLDDLSREEDFRNKANRYYKRLEQEAIFFSFIKELDKQAEINAAKNYIRMNARGKTLEPFENLKAMIDSIRDKIFSEKEKSGDEVDFIKKYDNKYIDILFKVFHKDEELEQKTRNINQKSLNCLKKIYNLNCELMKLDRADDNEFHIEIEDAKFISKIYDYSQRELRDTEKEFFKNYIKILVSFFDYYADNYKELNKETLDYESKIKSIFEDMYTMDEEEKIFIESQILYIHYYRLINDNKVINVDKIIKYNYVLINLNLKKWKSNRLESINYFAKQISKSDDIYHYFINSKEEEIQKYIKDNLDDIKVRIKEQKIKIMIIKEHNLAWDYFQELEARNGERKIQYLLYISGYWNKKDIIKNDDIEYKKLDKFIDIAKKYYFNPEVNKCEWLKIYAITVYMNSENELESESYINQNVNDKHRWNDDFYYWNDDYYEDLPDKEKLYYIEKAYANIQTVEELIDELQKNPEYSKCWLKYAIIFSKDYDSAEKLLGKALIWNEEESIAEYKKYSSSEPIRSDIYIMTDILEWDLGHKKLTEEALYEKTFKPGESFNKGNRKYNIRLLKKTLIYGVNKKYDEKRCVYKFDEEDKIYTIMFFCNPYECYQYKYDLSIEIEEQIEKKDELLDEMKKYTDEYLEKISKYEDYEGWGRPDTRYKTWNHINEYKIEYKGDHPKGELHNLQNYGIQSFMS